MPGRFLYLAVTLSTIQRERRVTAVFDVHVKDKAGRLFKPDPDLDSDSDSDSVSDSDRDSDSDGDSDSDRDSD